MEDESMVRNMAQTILTLLGFEVLTACDGMEALKVFRQHRKTISCVMLDLTMPRMNGWKTLSALREIQPDLRAILTSGHDMLSMMRLNHPHRPQVYLQKPYGLTQLQEALQKLLREETNSALIL